MSKIGALDGTTATTAARQGRELDEAEPTATDKRPTPPRVRLSIVEELLKKFPAAVRAKAEELKAFSREIKKEGLEEELSKLPRSAYVITHLIEFAKNHRSAMKS